MAGPRRTAAVGSGLVHPKPRACLTGVRRHRRCGVGDAAEEVNVSSVNEKSAQRLSRARV